MLELFKNNNVKTDKLSLVLPLVLFVLYLIWSALLPISKAPDEIARIQVPFFIIQNGYLPSGWEESIRNPIWGISYAFTTYGASLIALPFIKFASFFTDDVGTMIFAARIPSCMFGALTVAVLMETSKLLNFNEKSRFLIGTTLGLLPQFAFLSSYHNQDIFSVFCASLVLLCWVLAIRDGLSVKLCVYWGLSLGLLSLSYYFAYSFIPLSIIFFCVIARWQQIPIKQATKYALLIFAVAFAIAGWFFIRNAIIYDGDIFGRSAYYQSAELFAMDEYRPSVLKTPQMEGKSLLDILFSREWFWSTFKSSISVLGYMQYALPKWVYVICLGLVCTSILVSLKTSLINNLKKGGVKQDCVRGNREIVFLWFMLATSGICTVLLSVYYSWSGDFQPQGRYIICAWIPIILAIETCFQQITEKLLQTKKSQNIFIFICIACSIAILLMAIYSSYPALFNGIMFEYNG